MSFLLTFSFVDNTPKNSGSKFYSMTDIYCPTPTWNSLDEDDDDDDNDESDDDDNDGLEDLGLFTQVHVGPE